ncbi:MAG: peptidylprolyl isomerase [Candidatus Cloacimonetes bacterium]|nr:peptidylprolyl isomerase [Candidatus Cloacimonadota bacterium]
MRKYILFTLFAFVTLCLYANEKIDFIVAKVGRDIILHSELLQQKNQMKTAGMFREEMDDLLILQNMIDNKLIIQKAKDLNIKVDDRRIANTVESQFNAVKAQFRSEEDFFRELRAAGMLPSDLKKYYEESYTEQFLRERLIQTEIRSKLKLSDADIHAFYLEEKQELPLRDETFQVAMILRIPGPSPETDKQALATIEDVRDRVNRGEDFGQLAQEFSECPSAAQLGDLGFFARGMMVPEFENAAFRLDIGGVSEIVKTQFGYHLIKLTDRKGSEIRASHILILLAESDDDILREELLMADIHGRLVSGDDFGTLALAYSQDSDSASNKGVIGALTKAEFPEMFATELSELEVGDFSAVLQHQKMFYIFKVNQAFEPRPYEYEEITEQLREMLSNRLQATLYQAWMENLKKEIFVQIYEDKLEIRN